MWFSLIAMGLGPVSAQGALPEALPGYGGSLLRMFGALVFVSVLAYLLLRFGLRRLSGTPGRSQRMHVVERCPLGGSKALWIVRVGQRVFLVGGADQGMTMLAELDEGDLGEGEMSTPSPRFSEVFSRVLGRGTSKRGGEKDPGAIRGDTKGDARAPVRGARGDADASFNVTRSTPGGEADEHVGE